MIDESFTTFFNKAKQLVCTCAAPRRCSGSADFLWHGIPSEPPKSLFDSVGKY